MRSIPFFAILSLGTSLPLTAQTPSRVWDYLAADSRVQPRPTLRRCTEPQVRVGVLRAVADLQFVVDRNGRPDTTSVNLIAVAGASAEGFQSAARRYLGTCRFRPGQVEGRSVSTLVLARMSFARDSTVLMTSREPADSLLPLVWLEPLQIEAGRIYENADVELDEKPRLLPCGRDLGTFKIPDDAYVLLLMSGRAELEFVILPSGTPDRSTARVLRTDNPRAAREAMTSYMSCRYAPGRVGGQPVAVRVRVVH